MPKERFKSVLAVFIILVKDERVFLIRRFQTGYRDGDYAIPGGHLEAHESLMAGTIREAKEELGIDIETDALRLAHVLDRDTADGHRVGFFFIADHWTGEPRNNELDKCDHADWFPLHDLPKNLIDYDRVALGALQIPLSINEMGW